MYDDNEWGLVRNYGLFGQSSQRTIARCKHCLADQGESIIGDGPDGGGVFVGNIIEELRAHDALKKRRSMA